MYDPTPPDWNSIKAQHQLHFRWIVLEKETLHRYNGRYGAVCWTVVLSAVLTHHRSIAGCRPLCSAAIYVSDPILTDSGTNCNSICKGFEKKAPTPLPFEQRGGSFILPIWNGNLMTLGVGHPPFCVKQFSCMGSNSFPYFFYLHHIPSVPCNSDFLKHKASSAFHRKTA